MHSIKNISERNKIDTQSRADAYIRKKRLISKSDYNYSLDAPKSILETEKTLRTLSSGQIYKKNQKTPKNQKKTKNQKKQQQNPTGLGFLKNPGFFQPCFNPKLAETKEIEERPLVLTGQAFVAGGGRRRGGGAVVGRLVRALNVYLLQDKPAKVCRCFQSDTIHYRYFYSLDCTGT
jgi:hypothetical protein